MAENLKVTHFRDGELIPNITDVMKWGNSRSSAYCNYDNNPANVDVYGRLYNWHAVSDSHGIAPIGWHVPTDDEWKKLEMFLGMNQAEADKTQKRGTNQGGSMKVVGSTHWYSPNEGATNACGFSALPGGCRLPGSTNFISLSFVAYFWSSKEGGNHEAWFRSLSHSSSTIDRGCYYKVCGYSVRCIKD